MQSRQAVYRFGPLRWVGGGLVCLCLLGCSVTGLAAQESQNGLASGRVVDGPVPRTAEADLSQKARTGLEVYPPTPGVALEERVTATVEGQRLPLLSRRIFHADSSGERFMEVAVGWFAAAGPVTMSLAAAQGDIGRPVLRTVGRDLAGNRSGSALTFALPGPGHYYLQLPGLARPGGRFTVALWVDDLRHRQQTQAAVEVTARGIRSDSALDQTAALQALLNAGGILLFPAGVYRTGTLHIRSHTTLLLAPGAVLRAVEKEDAVGAEFIAIENARHVKLCGPGIVDAASAGGRRRHNVHNVNITSSQDVTFEDVLFEGSNSWAVHIRRSERVTARRVRIFSGKDGFDPDSSRDVLIDGAFVMSGDDAIAVKNRFPTAADGGTTERVTFRNSIVSTTKSALKIGTETRGPIRDVIFEHCDVFDGERGIVLYAQDGGPIERAIWRDIRLFLIDWPQEKDSGTVFHLIVSRRDGATPVRQCRIEDVTANWIYRSEFAGLPDAPLDGVTLRNIRIKVDPPKSGKPSLFVCGDDVRLSIEGLALDWQGNEARWAGIMAGQGLTFSDSLTLPTGDPTRTKDEGNTTK